jgi:hypothetical protein
MSNFWKALVYGLALYFTPGILRAQADVVPPLEQLKNPPARVEPTDGILLPTQLFDPTVKVPNNTRERQGQWTVMGGVYLWQPIWQSNPAFVIGSAGGNLSRQIDFSHHVEVAPQVWLGYVSERGWGLRGRWFDFDHGASVTYGTASGDTIKAISPLPLGQVAVSGTGFASSNIAFNGFDIQATCSHETAKWSFLTGFGVRYTHLSQDYQATLTSPGTAINVGTGHNFNGAGPSFSFEGKRCIGETGFAVYGNVNGAVLFGTAKEDYNVLNNGIHQEFSRQPNTVLPIGELEIGAEYSRNVGRARAFVQTGFVGQVWWGGGNASNIDPNGFTSASSQNFGFVGLSLRAGIRY